MANPPWLILALALAAAPPLTTPPHRLFAALAAMLALRLASASRTPRGNASPLPHAISRTLVCRRPVRYPPRVRDGPLRGSRPLSGLPRLLPIIKQLLDAQPTRRR